MSRRRKVKGMPMRLSVPNVSSGNETPISLIAWGNVSGIERV
jgi:hypothetical protein